jgi:8-oxo-dGTP pyrophosphatase MutT (NUDIX family)
VAEDDDKELYTIMTIQPRTAATSLAFAEIPAGMIDDHGTFAGAAAQEIKEEAELEVRADELIDLTALTAEFVEDGSGEQLQKAMYPSPGGCDEFIPIFLWRKRLPRAQLEAMEGKLTGERDDGEMITLKIVKARDLWKVGFRDGKTLAAWALYSGLKAEGKI